MEAKIGSELPLKRLSLVFERIESQCRNEGAATVDAYAKDFPFIALDQNTVEGLMAGLNSLLQKARTSERALNSLCKALDVALDELQDKGVFGAFGENDPRGNFRIDDWSMWGVEGVDESY